MGARLDICFRGRNVQQEKEPKPKLFGPIFSGEVGVKNLQGWGPTILICPWDSIFFTLLSVSVPVTPDPDM